MMTPNHFKVSVKLNNGKIKKIIIVIYCTLKQVIKWFLSEQICSVCDWYFTFQNTFMHLTKSKIKQS